MCNLRSLYLPLLLKISHIYTSYENVLHFVVCGKLITNTALQLFLDKSRGAELPSSSNLKERPSIQSLTITSVHSTQASI